MLAKAIAIIDDEVDLVNLFKEALEMDGFMVCTFTDPLEAYNKLRHSLDKYAIIISDYRMPSINGNDLCVKLKSLNPELKIILTSAFDEVQYDISSKFVFVRKPIHLAQLIKIVKENLAD
jgi:DNA-binding NtrC family response regulator